MHKLALGTVQFGLDYGISNARGQVTPPEVVEILQLAAQAGVQVLDTAYAYGNSEQVLGEALPQIANHDFRLVSKFPPGTELPAMAEVLSESLGRLGRKSLYGYLFHSLETYEQQPKRWAEMLALKALGKIQRVGFSLYHPQEALDLLNAGVDFDLIQVPFSVLDQRWAAVFPQLKAAGVEIHVRSAFLQGLVFQDPAALGPHFASAIPSLKRMRALSAEHDISIAGLCLGLGLLQPEIDQVVIGVAEVAQFRENIALVRQTGALQALLPELSVLGIEDEQVLLPMYWPKNG